MIKVPSSNPMRIFTGNRLEHLGHLLSEMLAFPLSSPLAPEIVIVQSQGMARWISMTLARDHGICANYWFPFPNAFFNWLFKSLDPGLPDISPFDPEKMTWRILKHLKTCVAMKEFESLKSYLGNEATQPAWGLKGFQLSRRIADIFDQYLLFRPEMMLKWEQGEAAHWQAILWRKLMEGQPSQHRASLARAFLDAVSDGAIPLENLPQRVSVFGISALPPYHMTLLSGLAQLIPVQLFVMNPCQEFWGDIVSGRERFRKSLDPTTPRVRVEDLHLEKGNSLLASMGTLGRDFFDLVETLDAETHEDYHQPGRENLLCTIQSHILNLKDGETVDPKPVIDSNDTSIQIHSCHSPMREVEVLYDCLLDMFESEPDLQPKDILVMTPDIDTYAPLIEAVFDTPGDQAGRIPFSIADRSIKKQCEIIDTFLEILELPGSRFSAPRILNVLESEAVRRRFGLADRDVDLVRRWVEETAIRWGIDEKDRENLGFSGLQENSWAAGIKRLLLGYAMPGQREALFGGILPYDPVEGGETLVLGAFVQFIDRLFAHVTGLNMPVPPGKWSRILNTLLDDMFLPDETVQTEVQSLRETFYDLQEMSVVDGGPFEAGITLDVVKEYLQQHLQEGRIGHGFMTSGITFCALLPMRSIPFKIICLLGMNGRDYPRETIRVGFDMLAERPRPGDRSRRNDDRYLFLETLLSVRSTLYISYVGQSIQDNSLSPPSVLVSELLDYTEAGFEFPQGKIRDPLVTRHRLQPSHPDYFQKNEQLFSYSGDLCEAARGLLAPAHPGAPFITTGLSSPEADFQRISVNDLDAFFANPAKYLLRKRLDIQLEEENAPLEASEPFELTGLEHYHMAQDLLSKRLEGHDLNALFECRKACGQLPHGEVGKHTFDTLCQKLERFAQETQPYLAEPLDTLDIDLEIQGVRLTGRLHDLYPDHQFAYRYALIKAMDRLRIWIHHLILNALAHRSYPRTSILAGLAPKKGDRVWAAWKYGPLEKEESVAHLKTLLDLYQEGLIRPLLFFPESAYALVWALKEKNKSRHQALEAARLWWQGSDYRRGEGEDPYYQYSFRDTDPLDERFEDISLKILSPLLEHQEDV
ncbi:MAG: exodeoxyribonuclease V subunit gamma [Thermodesulfobacteriota bacterium]